MLALQKADYKEDVLEQKVEGLEKEVCIHISGSRLGGIHCILYTSQLKAVQELHHKTMAEHTQQVSSQPVLLFCVLMHIISGD